MTNPGSIRYDLMGRIVPVILKKIRINFLTPQIMDILLRIYMFFINNN
jgi:hypothetical protein